ncbi:MAG: hypothetical protein ACYT04_32105 [Nostoc sp.]
MLGRSINALSENLYLLKRGNSYSNRSIDSFSSKNFLGRSLLFALTRLYLDYGRVGSPMHHNQGRSLPLGLELKTLSVPILYL